MSTLVFNIPFPAWELLTRLSLVRTAMIAFDDKFKVIPYLESPRRITVKDNVKRHKGEKDFDDVIQVRFWWPGGVYLDVRLGGIEDSWGTQWEIRGGRLRWKDVGRKTYLYDFRFGSRIGQSLRYIGRNFHDEVLADKPPKERFSGYQVHLLKLLASKLDTRVELTRNY